MGKRRNSKAALCGKRRDGKVALWESGVIVKHIMRKAA